MLLEKTLTTLVYIVARHVPLALVGLALVCPQVPLGVSPVIGPRLRPCTTTTAQSELMSDL